MSLPLLVRKLFEPLLCFDVTNRVKTFSEVCGCKIKEEKPRHREESARKSDRRKERIVVVDDDDARFYSDDITTGKFHRTCL